MGLSRSWSRAGQWDGVSASCPSPSFYWNYSPEGKRDVGRRRIWGCPRQGDRAGRGMAGKTLGRGDADPLPLLKCHPYSMDYGGAEADEQSTGNI